MVLRNINMFPVDEYRCVRTWELMEKMSSFVVKAPTDIVGLSFENLNDVSIVSFYQSQQIIRAMNTMVSGNEIEERTIVLGLLSR